MRFGFLRRAGIAAAAVATFGTQAGANAAYLFWSVPNFAGAPVKGDEPGIGLPMPEATPKELDAHLLWNMRAGLNVAALQCQFSPALMTVSNYNDVLKQHTIELNKAYQAIEAYFKRTGGKTWRVAFDQYTTRTYNGFSTLHAQLGFCDTASDIGLQALSSKRGDLHEVAQQRMREFRNSLVPVHERMHPWASTRPVAAPALPTLDPKCWDKKDVLRKRCRTAVVAAR